MGSSVFMVAKLLSFDHGQWQRKPESRPKWIVCTGPELSLMSFNNRATNRQTHAHSIFLGGEKGFEDFVVMSEPDSVVLNLDESCARTFLKRSNHDFPGPIGDGFHCVQPVHQQVQNELLNLDSITEYG